MENQLNSQQPIHSNLNLSETEITSEAATCSKRTAAHSNTSVNIANNADMGKCLSVCKEQKKPFLSKSESPADAPSSSPDRNDPTKIITSRSSALGRIGRTNRAMGRTHALTENAKNLGHVGVTFISVSAVGHERENGGEQSLKLEENRAKELDCDEKEEKESAPPPVSDPENVGCEREERTSGRRQQHTDEPPSGTAKNTPNDAHSNSEEGSSPQNDSYNHRLTDANSDIAGYQDNQGNDHSSAGVQKEPENEKDLKKHLENEKEEDINEYAKSASPALTNYTKEEEEEASPDSGETPAKPQLTSPQKALCSVLQRKDSLSDIPLPESSTESRKEFQGLHQLLETSRPHSHSIYASTHSQNVTEIDILRPSDLDGPSMQLSIHLKPQQMESFTELSLRAIQVLRLPRLQSCKNFDLDTFLYDLAENSSGLNELVFEDAGQISKRTANILADNKCLKRLEVHDPKVPLLRALTIGCSELEEVCFHGLTTDGERELRLYIREKGLSLKSLSLNFNNSARQAGWKTEQKEFFARILKFLDSAVPDELPKLQTLEISSCPSYEAKHTSNAPGTTSTNATVPQFLDRVDAIIRKKERAHHPKESMILLTKVKLRGHITAITDALGALSWANQDNMEIEVELPGVSVIYPRGFGIMKPVVLTFLQLDQFISQGSRSQWLELTALREIDLGEMMFVQKYNADIAPIRAATRRLLVTSRESLSRVRACYKILTKGVCVETHKILSQIVPLTPSVNHLDISRDIVLHASVADYEYVHTIMLLRRWNLKTVQLVSTHNYGTVETANAEINCEKCATEEFLRKLPAFLTILAAACPKLENLVLESEETSEGWRACLEQARLLADALRALEVYQTVVPTVKVGTLRGQLLGWESTLQTDKS